MTESVVQVGSMEFTSNSQTPEAMVTALTPEPDKDDKPQPKVIGSDGKPVGEEDAKVKEAASELGKRGGKAAAEKRAADKADEKPDQKPQEAAGDDKADKDEPKGEAEDKSLGKPRHDPRARMLEATRQAAEAKRETARVAAENAELRRVLDEQARGGKPEPKRAAALPDDNPEDPKPQEDDFEAYADFVEARGAWAARREYSRIAQSQAQEQSARSYYGKIEKIENEAREAAEAFRAEAPDFTPAEHVAALYPSWEREQGEQLRPDHVLADEILRAKANGPRLVRYLSDHPEEFQRIVALRTPQEVQVECRILAKSLSAVTAGAAQAQISKAKPPVRPVAGSPQATTDDEFEEGIDFREYVKRRAAKERQAVR